MSRIGDSMAIQSMAVQHPSSSATDAPPAAPHRESKTRWPDPFRGGPARKGARRETMWRRIGITCAVASSLASAPVPTAASAVVYAMAGTERFAIERAIAGAALRLDKAECQRVLTDFTDPSGRTLAENLAALGKTPAEFFNELFWVDDRDTLCCRRRCALAFTAPGYRVIRVCGRRFAEVSLGSPIYGDAVFIHEMLHALGLAENPPRSVDITRRVIARCS